jgi:hypothetical protein
MLPGVAAFTRLVGIPDKCVQAVAEDGLPAFVFRSGPRVCAVACNTGGPRSLGKPPGAVRVCDIMGNPVSSDPLVLDVSPVFILAPAASGIAPCCLRVRHGRRQGEAQVSTLIRRGCSGALRRCVTPAWMLLTDCIPK